MSDYIFSRVPQIVDKFSTKNRIIKTEIPCPGSERIISILDNYESRSMHGQLPLVWDHAKDYNIYDSAGNKWIDFTSAIFFTNVGHSNNRVSKYLERVIQEKPLIGCYAYGNEIRAKYLKKLLEFAGPNFQKAFLMSAGTEATEAALKLMRMHGQKKLKKNLGIIAFEGNWHGRTMGAQMMSGNEMQKAWIGKLDEHIHHLPCPYHWDLNKRSGESFFYDSIKILQSKGIDFKSDLCGMILETFQGWGAIFYPKDFVQAAEDFCRKNDLLLSFDEMQSGFARTGMAFGYQHYDVNPDILCCGKGMGNGYPLSGVIGKEEVMDLPEIGNMSSTHSANPMACSAGLAVIEEINNRNLIEEAKNKGMILHSKLNELKEKSNNKISYGYGKGLIASIIFQDSSGNPNSALPSKVAEICMQKGLLVVHTGRESIKLGPPLTITNDALIEGINVLSDVILDNI